MPKPETDTEYHVTLHTPIGIKLGSQIVMVRSFDATTEWERGLIDDSIVWKVDRIWRHANVMEIQRGVSFKSSLVIPAKNIAGLVPQPFVER